MLTWMHSVAALVVPPAVVNLGMAGAAGAMGAAVVYPIDLIKTRLQSTAGAAQYDNGVQAVQQLLASEGPLGFFKGLGPQLTGVVPEKTIKLFVHDSTVLWLGEAASGALAGLCQVVVTNPLEIVKVRLQLAAGRQLSALEVIGELGGLGGLYTGAVPCAVRDSAFSAILFPCYAAAQSALGAVASGPVVLLLAGGLAAAPAAYLTTPADVVKTRMQQGSAARARALPHGRAAAGGRDAAWPARAAETRGETATPPQASALRVAEGIVRDEGPSALFQGGLERVLRSSPQFSVTLCVYGLLKDACVERGWLP